MTTLARGRERRARVPAGAPGGVLTGAGRAALSCGRDRAVVLVAAVAMTVVLAGCADLDAVKAYGTAAARNTSTVDAGLAYRDSATALAPYLADPPLPAQQPAVRARQVRAAVALQAALTSYFATLAKLAGADAFALDRQIDHVATGLKALPADDLTSPGTVQTAAALMKTLADAVTLPAQSASVHRLVDDGGPPAMALLARLRAVIALWQVQVVQDRDLVLAQLDVLAMARDAPPLAVLLARDRAAELGRQYAAALRSLAAADLALDKLAVAHAELATHLDALSGPVLAQRLGDCVADLRALHADLELLP